MPTTSVIYNDNKACVQWSKSTTTKGLRHIQMKNRIRENIQSKFISIDHVDGKINLADIFTKEMKDVNHFAALQDLFMQPHPIHYYCELSCCFNVFYCILNFFLLFLLSI